MFNCIHTPMMEAYILILKQGHTCSKPTKGKYCFYDFFIFLYFQNIKIQTKTSLKHLFVINLKCFQIVCIKVLNSLKVELKISNIKHVLLSTQHEIKIFSFNFPRGEGGRHTHMSKSDLLTNISISAQFSLPISLTLI